MSEHPLRISVYPADEGGCGNYRLIWPSKALQEQGFAGVTINMPNEDHGNQINAIMRRTTYGSFVSGVQPMDTDVVVLQRPLRADLVAAIPFIKEQGIAVVIEVDDHFSAIDPRNSAWSHVQGGHRSHYHLTKACAMADLVTVTTPALAKVYGLDTPVVIIPNYVPKWYTEVEYSSQYPPTIGWTGSVATHPTDLPEVGGAVAQLVAQGSAHFGVLGTRNEVARQLGLPPGYEMDHQDWVVIEEYPLEMAKFDVGIVPLALTPFNQAKSWLKGLEFASLGIPFVASPTDPYIQLYHEYGIGRLAKTRKWWAPLRTAVLRHHDLGLQYRQAVIDHKLTIEDNAHQWYTAWVRASEIAKERRAA